MCDAKVGDVHTCTEVNCLHLLAMLRNVNQCGIGDVDASIEGDAFDSISVDMIIDEIDYVQVSQLLSIVYIQFIEV